MRQVHSFSTSSSKMSSLLSRLGAAIVLGGLAVGGLAGCGGGGHGFGVDANPIKITSAVLPTAQSGEKINYLIPFTGGDGGPYLLEVLDGALPGGITFDNNTVALVGQILEDDIYKFTLKLTDTGKEPFASTTQHYEWAVGKGALVFATDANLPPYVFNKFDVINLTLAGGTGPFSCEVIDDPTNAIDELLPSGLSIPADANSIVGAPVGVKPATPFIYKVSIKATDHSVNALGQPAPLTVVKLFTITVLVPDLVLTTTSVPNGVCGQPYTAKINTVDGIAPFFFNIVEAPLSTATLKGELAVAKGSVVAGNYSAYDAETSNGGGSAAAPSYGSRFPEGIFIRESSGDILGRARRFGSFSNWTVRAASTVLPATPGQNKWRTLAFAMANSVPPNLALDNAALLTGNIFGAAGNNFFAGPSKGKTYSKQFTALNGCAQDGKFDAPHETLATNNVAESDGNFDFSNTFFSLFTANTITIAADPTKVPPGLTFSKTGLFSGIATSTSVFQTVTVKCEDSQLPLPRPASHIASGTAQFEIGPDTVVITESSISSSSAIFDNNMDYNTQTVEILEPSASGPIVRALVSPPTLLNDMVAGHSHPIAGGTLAGSLTNIDILRVSVNPTWWAYDGYNLNSLGARTMQHADGERRHYTDAFGGDCGYAYYENTPSLHNQGKEHASDPAIELPAVQNVRTAALVAPFNTAAQTHNQDVTGVYTNGGLLYGYDNASEFGFFIVRKDSKIEIPVAFNKAASGFSGFGDAWITSSASFTGMFRIPQITVSPNGRMAAVKVKGSLTGAGGVDNFAETCSTERVCLFSLTGEKMFGGSTFVTLTTGGAGDTTDGQYLYGSSLTLTDYALYALRGNNIGGFANTQDRVIYADHWIYRAMIFNPTGGGYQSPTTMALLGAPVANNFGWTNTTNNPISCPFQRWSSPGSAANIFGYGTAVPGGSSPLNMAYYYDTSTSSFSGGNQTNTAASLVSVSPDFWHFSWANFGDNSGAPHPFRVSADGHACVIVAGANLTSGVIGTGTSNVNFLRRSVYVDFDGSFGNFREASDVVRRYKSASRTIGLYEGELVNRLYGWFDGPATQLEVSDDGTKIAVVYNASTTAWTTLMFNNMSFTDTREELAYFQGTAALNAPGTASDPWSTKNNGNPTTTVTTTVFANTYNWRLGCIAFTRDNKAFTFWGGLPIQGPTTYSYAYIDGCTIAGSLYAYTPGGAPVLEGILPSAQGGHAQGVQTYSVSGTLNNYSFGSQTANQGTIKPNGSFFSNDGKFYWIETYDALDGTTIMGHRLSGVNVGTLGVNINTSTPRVPLRAFSPTWPTSGGHTFSVGLSYPFAYPGQAYYGGSATNRIASNVSAGSSNGLVFYASYGSNLVSYASSKYSSSSSWSAGSNALATGWQHYYGTTDAGAELYAMDSSLGGSPQALSALGLAQRAIPYIQPSPTGSRVAFQTTAITSANLYETTPPNEQLRIVSNITVTGAGVLSATSPVVLEATNGRMGPSLALDSSGTKVYYAFSTNGTENGMVLKEVTLNVAGTAIVGSPRTFNGVSGTPARFAVLWSGR